MNILYLSHRVPYPPNKGEKTRIFSLIRYLALEHHVHVVCLADERGDLEHAETLKRSCDSVDVVFRGPTWSKLLGVAGLLSRGRPASVGSFYSSALMREMDARVRATSFDCVVVSTSSMASYVERAPLLRDVPKVLDFIDVDSEKWRQYAAQARFPASKIYAMEAECLARYEEDLARTFDLSLFDSDDEGDLLRRRVPECSIRTIPDGVDLEYFTPSTDSSGGPPVIVFTGTMSYRPNADAVVFFAAEVLPLVKREVPDAQFHIVGRKPGKEVVRLGRDPDVLVTGEVPDVRPYLNRAAVAVAPLRIARGLQVKVLEAMAMGVPMVGTSQAFLGMNVTSADGVRVAESPEPFSQAVVELLQDDGLRRECAAGVRRYVEAHHEWRALGARIESMLRELVLARSG